MTAPGPHVLFDLRVVSDHFPGIGRYAFELAQVLPEVAPGWRFTFLIQANQAANSRFDLASLARWPNVTLRPAAPAIFSWQGQLRLRLPPADLAHFPYYIFPYLTRRRIVTTIYDIISHIYPAYLPSVMHRALFELTTRLALARSAHVLTLSHSAAHDLQRVYGVASRRISVTPAAADARFRPAAPAAVANLRQRLGLGERYVLFVGANKPHKNLRRLIEAWVRMQAQGRLPVQLALAGREDPRYTGARQEIAQAGLQEEIKVLGAIGEADLPALYSGAELFVLPSLYEGYGLPLIEAMACGAAVVCSSASSLPEVAGNDPALLFDPERSEEIAAVMRRLLVDDGLRTAQRVRSLARARQFNWHATAMLTLAAYEKAASGSTNLQN